MCKFYFSPILILVVIVFATSLVAQELVANINQANDGSSPEFLMSNENWTVFFADDGKNGSELYVIDTPGGEAKKFQDTLTLAGIQVTSAYLVDSSIYLNTGSGENLKVWLADLRLGLYTLLIESSPNTRGQQLARAVSFGNQVALFFNITNPDIWLTDGTMVGTRFITTAPDVRLKTEIVSVDTLIYFVADSPFDDVGQLWRFDGTEDGTFPLTNFNPGSPFVAPVGLVPYKDKLYFAASSNTYNYELYATNGSVEGTSLFYEFEPGIRGGDPGDLQVYNDTLFFRAFNSTIGTEIWYTDGINTEVYADLSPGAGEAKLFNLDIGGSVSFFSRLDTNNVGSLWRTDFSPEGTFKIRDYFLPGATSVYGRGKNLFFEDEGLCYFIAADSLTGRELWVTDGTREDTKIVGEVYSGSEEAEITSLSSFGQYVYLIGNGNKVGKEIWTATKDQGIDLVLDVNNTEESSFPVIFDTTALGDILFSAVGECVGRELYVSSGTAPSTNLVKDIQRGIGFSNIREGFSYQGKRYFLAESERFERTLFVTDGTEEGTNEILRFILQDGSGSGASAPYLFKGKIYVGGANRLSGQLLLTYDPITEVIDTIFQSFGPTFSGSSFRAAALNDSILLFSSEASIAETVLYRTDGTRQGTSLVRTIPRGDLLRTNGEVYFITYDQFTSDIWRTDGTVEGTQRVVNGNNFPNARQLLGVGNNLYFSAIHNGVLGLFCLNSTSTLPFRISPQDNLSLSEISNLFEFKGRLFFTGSITGSGTELWTTDGTSAGTRMIKDIAEGEESASPRFFLIRDSLLYFSAFNTVTGRELYRSDGTDLGTVLIADIKPGAASSNPASLFNSRNAIYFSADGGKSGAELWRYKPSNPDSIDENNDPNGISESCSDTSTRVGDIFLMGTFTVSPNPFKSRVTVGLSPGIFRLELYNTTGQLLWGRSNQEGQVEIDLSLQTASQYFLRIIEESTGRHRVEKLISYH